MSDEKVDLQPGETTENVKAIATESQAVEGADVPPATIVSRETVDMTPPAAKSKGGKRSGKLTRDEVKSAVEKVASVVQDATTSDKVQTAEEPAADASEATPGGKKGGRKGKSSAVPAKNVNARRVLEPKTTATPSGMPVVPGTPIEAKAATVEPKRGRGRPKGSGKVKEPKATKEPKTPKVPAIILPTGPLTESEVARLDTLETEVAGGLTMARQSFLMIGTALLEIRNGALYRGNFTDYESYLRDRWDISPRQERHYVGGVQSYRVLESAGVEKLPSNESQTRFLVGVADEKKPAVWNLAVEKAAAEGRQEPTRDQVKEAADEVGRVSPRAGKATTTTGTPMDRKTAGEVGRAQSSGVLPTNVTIDVTRPDGNSEDEPDDDLITGPVEDIQMDDDKWILQFPLYKQLSTRCQEIFKADALAYRWLDGPRVSFIRNAFRPILKAARKDSGQWLGPYVNRMLYTLRMPHPSKWVACPSCKGSGQRPEGKGECGDCKKCGYRLP